MFIKSKISKITVINVFYPGRIMVKFVLFMQTREMSKIEIERHRYTTLSIKKP